MKEKERLTDAQMWDVFKQSPAVVIDAVVLQDEQLADVPGSDVTGYLHSPAGIIFTVHFDYLQQTTFNALLLYSQTQAFSCFTRETTISLYATTRQFKVGTVCSAEVMNVAFHEFTVAFQ